MENHVVRDVLDGALDIIRQSPASEGSVELIVCRPAVGERKVLEEGELSVEHGLVGDNWSERWSGKEEHLARHLDMQINIMNARAIDTIAAGENERWSQAGDQLYVDFDLSADNLPPGTRLKVGEAVLEVTAEPHLGCAKFKERFGKDAVMWVNSDAGKQVKLRGINARVVEPGVIRRGGVISKLAPF